MADINTFKKGFPLKASDLASLFSYFKTLRLAASGTPLTAANVTVGAGWGSTATVSGIGGTDMGGQINITAGGAGIASGASVTLTFADGAWPVIPTVMSVRNDIALPIGAIFAVFNISTTFVTFTFGGLPVAGTTYAVRWMTMGN